MPALLFQIQISVPLSSFYENPKSPFLPSPASTMSTTQTPTHPNPNLQSRSNRKPLQPKLFSSADNILPKSSSNRPQWLEITLAQDSNKENTPISSVVKKIEPFDSSLAEELNVIRKRLERLRLEREKTEKLLKKRDMVLEMKMKEIENRGQVQRKVEMEVDKLLGLNALESYCAKASPIRSLREREEEKKIKQSEIEENELKEKESESETSKGE